MKKYIIPTINTTNIDVEDILTASTTLWTATGEGDFLGFDMLQ